MNVSGSTNCSRCVATCTTGPVPIVVTCSDLRLGAGMCREAPVAAMEAFDWYESPSPRFKARALREVYSELEYTEPNLFKFRRRCDKGERTLSQNERTTR
jgi:hypothetical protein